MYLGKQHRRWWAYHDIPPSLRPAFDGRKRLTRNLQTENEATARRRADLLWAHDWSKQIAAAKAGAKGQAPVRVEPKEGEAAFYRDLLTKAGSEEERALIESTVADEARSRAIRALEAAGFTDWPRTPEQEEEAASIPGYVEAERFAALATGAVTPFLDHMEEWLALLQNEAKTKGQKRGTLVLFAKAFPFVEDVKPEAVQRWFNARARDEALAKKTLKRVQSELAGYWKHLGSLGVVPKKSSLFTDLEIYGEASDGWDRFKPAEVVALRAAAAARGDRQLADLITLAMWTGARIESLCALTVNKVERGAFKIEADKTPAGRREVPIHSRLIPTLERLCRESKDGFVLSGLPVTKYGDRSDALGKRFGRLKTALGFGRLHVFHSIRKTVVRQMEAAGVPENVAADIVGHEKPRITFGTYSGRNELDLMREAIERVSYPEGAVEGGEER